MNIDWLEYVKRQCADKGIKRADMVKTYAGLLLESENADPPFGTDFWRPINEAIIERWSRSGLTWIKERAWKAVCPYEHHR